LSEAEETPDSHDLGKLTRWHEGLNAETGRGFPVCALFLASGEDTRAHDIFRVYRSAFEALDAGFHDLVIFGQHGMSTTCAALIQGLGLSGLDTPSLVLINDAAGMVFHSTRLPAGSLADGQTEEDGAAVAWRVALTEIERSAKDGVTASLGSVKGLERMNVSGETLAEAVGRVKLEVEAA
jgi:hypothetical protein